jgi:hypothetical protein
VAHHLFIVSRQEPGLFSYLSREFAGEPGVTVIYDRRQGERRTRAAPESLEVDRRQTDRRLKTELMRQLATLGYAFVRVAPPAMPDL